jgi:pyruvate dehydrogenase E2 component (dihydrolipoamide acetyltransferase)
LATSIVMPQLGYDMREGTIVRWLKEEGEAVTRGEIIAEIETDKAVVEFSPTTGGVLRRIVAGAGDIVPVGQLIAVIGDADEALPDELAAPTSPVVAAEAPPATPAPAPTPVAESPPAAPDSEVRASPIARRLAREKGVDLANLTGSGPGGRIVEADVLAAAAVLSAPGGVLASPLARRLAREGGIDLSSLTGSGPGGRIVEADVLAASVAPAVETPAPALAEAAAEPAAAPAGDQVQLSRMRQTIARVTSDSKREAPHFYVAADIDMSKAMDLRRDINDQVDPDSRVSVNDLIVKASAMAIGRHPKFNSFFRDEYLQMNPSINVGIAIALESGLIVPGIPGCEGRSLAEIAVASRDLAARATSGTLRADEYTGTTYSVSNLGMFGVDSFTAIIYPPHAAILAVGAVKEQPVVRSGEITIAQIMKATLSVDHRVADGAEAAQFLSEIRRLLENPVSLLL